MGYATITDYEALYGTVAADMGDTVTKWLNLTSAVIASRLSKAPDPEVAELVTCMVVERLLTTGNVRTRQSGGTSVTFATVGKMITEDEWEMLAGTKIGGQAGTLDHIDEVFRPTCEQLAAQRRRYDGWVPG